MNNWTPEIFNKAWYFATINHSGQTYGGSEPNIRIDYLNHIGSVVMEVIYTLQHPSNGKIDSSLAIQCALLHDTIEDTEATYKDIETHFGKNVAKGVLALTKNEKLKTKQEQIIDSLERIKKQPNEIWMVKLADRISNLHSPPYYWDAEKKKKYLIEAKRIYTELHEANHILADRLIKKIKDYENFYKK